MIFYCKITRYRVSIQTTEFNSTTQPPVMLDYFNCLDKRVSQSGCSKSNIMLNFRLQKYLVKGSQPC
jgi:hypothetical protein